MLTRDEHLAQVLADVSEQQRRGQKPDIDALTKQNPELADELRQLLAIAQIADDFGRSHDGSSYQFAQLMHRGNGGVDNAGGALADLRKRQTLAPNTVGDTPPALSQRMGSAALGISPRQHVVRGVKEKHLRMETFAFKFGERLRPFGEKQPLARVNPLLAPLHTDPRYDAVAALPALKGPVARAVRFVDPLKDSAP